MENYALCFPDYGVIFKVVFSPHVGLCSPLKRQRSKQGRAARLKPQESAPWIKSALLAGVACAQKPLCTLVFVLLAGSWAGKCVTASTKAFGDFLKKSFMELQILKRPFYMRALCAAPFCVPLPPLPDDWVPFKLL